MFKRIPDFSIKYSALARILGFIHGFDVCLLASYDLKNTQVQILVKKTKTKGKLSFKKQTFETFNAFKISKVIIFVLLTSYFLFNRIKS